MKTIKGFSKLSKENKILWLVNTYFDGDKEVEKVLSQYWNKNEALQSTHDEFSENTLSNFYLPFGVAPNFLINGKNYTVPMVTEESSVVAAASKAASFWLDKGGFKATVLDTKKIGHVHFIYSGEKHKLFDFFNKIQTIFFDDTSHITKNMNTRGGGILSISLNEKTHLEKGYFQLEVTFDTKDSMGANFINSCLEQIAKTLEREIYEDHRFSEREKDIQIIMSILSNYTPECIVKVEVSCHVDELIKDDKIKSKEFATKFVQAVSIAEKDTYRATTHNKGIMNGIDAVVIATGNDFRAVEAGAHAYAVKNNIYSSLSHAEIKGNLFHFWIKIPLSLGTVGGLTNIHPLVKLGHKLLDKPNAKELMMIVASVGLAQNFGALSSLTTTGIQKGHMKMHITNILNQLGANIYEKKHLTDFFKNKEVSYSNVMEELKLFRDKK